MENRTILFQGKEIDVDDEPGETSDMIHHPDHYTWKGTECKKVIEIMTRGLSGAEAYYMGNIIKYLYRYPKKSTLLSDLAKAEEYTKFLRKMEGKHERSDYFRATDQRPGHQGIAEWNDYSPLHLGRQQTQ